MPIEQIPIKLFALPTDESISEEAPAQVPVPKEMIEKRREARYVCNDPAEVRILSGNRGVLDAMVMDISKSGLRLGVASALAKGEKIEITLPKEVIIFGEVRYCRRAVESYHVGVSIEDVFYARRSDIGSHLHDDQLTLYLIRKELATRDVLGVRDHLLRCKMCAARCRAVGRLRERLGVGATAR
jgi:PilZ domain-containing protein